MSIAGLQPLPIDVFSGRATDIPPSDLPLGASPANQDVQFKMGAWETRPARLRLFPNPLAGFPSPSITGLVNYTGTDLSDQLLALGTDGNLYSETAFGSGVSTIIASDIQKNMTLNAKQGFGREYMAFSAVGGLGGDIPRQWDGVNFDRVSQTGPGAAPIAADSVVSGVIVASPNGLVPETPQTIVASPTGLVQVGDVVTITLASFADGAAIGDSIVIAGAGVSAYDGTFLISAIINPGVIQVINPTLGLAASGGGTLSTNLVFLGVPGVVGFTPPGGLITIAGAGVGTYDGTWQSRGVFFGAQSGLVLYIPGSNAFAASGGGTATLAGNISAGVHGVSVFFRTRQSFDTSPAPPAMWTAAGGLPVSLSNIPIGPPNVVARVVVFTAAAGANYFFVAATMIINDNTTTSATFDFTDSALLSGTNVDEYFNRVELGECAGFAIYADRLFGFAQRNKIFTFNNFSFDGGFNSFGTPLGWTADPTNGAGGSRVTPSSVWGDAYGITGDGVSALRGMISQSAITDPFGVMSLLQTNTAYSVRVKTYAPHGAPHGVGYTITIEIFSPTAGSLGLFNAVFAAGNILPVESIGPLMPAQATLPADAVLRIYSSNTLANGVLVAADAVEVFPTLTPWIQTSVSASLAGLPEAFDGETGLLEPEDAGDQMIMGGFQLRDRFYLVGQNWIGSTQDDKTNEPSLWDISETSNVVGTPSPNGIGIGEEWAVVASRNGLYIVWGGNEPIKISQEIQPDWDSINWDAGYSLWVKVDVKQKRILVGVPTGAATLPNQIFYFDYRGLDTATDIASYHSVRYSSYSGKILAIGDARKWSVWNIPSGSCGLIERPDGTQHTFIGNDQNNGLIWDLLDEADFPDGTGFSDDGAGIPWTYSTYYTPGHIDEQQLQLGAGRKLYGYLTGFVEGKGVMSITAQPLGNITPVQLASVNLVTSNPVAIASVKRVNGITTVMTSTPHGLTNNVDTQAVLSGVGGGFDGTSAIQIVLNATMFTIYNPGPNAILGAGGTTDRLLRDFEITTNVTGERVSYTFSNSGNAVGSWAKMQKLIPFMAPDPWSPVRGGP
jgi:hypothetical protein